MANWNTVVYTAKGLMLLSKLIAGSTLSITKIVSGAGLVPEGALREQTAVTEPKQQLLHDPVMVNINTQAEIAAQLRNTGVQAGYTARQIGVYASDPDEGEILLFIAQDAKGEAVPAEAEAPLFSISFTFLAQFGMTSRIFMQASLKDGLAPELAEHLFAPVSHLDAQAASDGGVHGLRYSKTAGALEKYDRETGTWAAIDVGSPRLQELLITTPPAKTAYPAGTVFQTEGMVVTAHYSQSACAAVTGYSISPARPLTVEDTAVTISYTANGITRTAQQAITVGELVRINIIMPPDTAEFVSGFYFDPAGMAIEAIYSNGSTQMVTDRVTYSPSGPLGMDDTEVTVSYTDGGVTETAVQRITVLHRLTGIAVITPPTRTIYTKGEIFSPQGMVLRAYYSDETQQTVTGYTWSPAGMLAGKHKVITIAYTEKAVTVTTEQEIAVKPAVSAVLAENDWETIARVSAAGEAQNYWSVGDEKKITLKTGEPLTLQIYGFDHDDLADGSGKAGITFGLKYLMAETRQMHHLSTNTGGFAASDMGVWLNSDLLGFLPPDLRTAVKPVIKKIGRYSEILNEEVSVFLFSVMELFGAVIQSAAGEGTHYPIFPDDESRGKYTTDLLQPKYGWWTRSARTSSNSQYCAIRTDGTEIPISIGSNTCIASWAYGVCFGFCI